MRTITKIIVTAAVTMLPLTALADDTTAKAVAAKPAVSELHGFDKYWSKMDPSGAGYVTKEHWMAHAAEQFKDIDTNGDGKISKEEMQAHDKKMHEHFMEMRQHRRMIMKNKSGMMDDQGQ